MAEGGGGVYGVSWKVREDQQFPLYLKNGSMQMMNINLFSNMPEKILDIMRNKYREFIHELGIKPMAKPLSEDAREQTNMSHIACSLAARLQCLRDNWLGAFSQVLEQTKSTGVVDNLSIEAAYPFVSAFQLVHTMSLIYANKYISEDKIGVLTSSIVIKLYGTPDPRWEEIIAHYENNKSMEIVEQVRIFCEDVAAAILNSYFGGKLYGTGATIFTMDFFFRNMAIVADEFSDYTKAASFAKSAKNTREAKA